jgi:hypothetical protein
MCKCVLYYRHRVATQLRLTNISYHIIYHKSVPRKPRRGAGRSSWSLQIIISQDISRYIEMHGIFLHCEMNIVPCKSYALLATDIKHKINRDNERLILAIVFSATQQRNLHLDSSDKTNTTFNFSVSCVNMFDVTSVCFFRFWQIRTAWPRCRQHMITFVTHHQT